jgi:NADH-quinone oxidoreductase subunit G
LRLGTGSARVPAPAVHGGAAAAAPLVLATWPELIDDGRLSVGDENLAGTAKPARAVISAATAAAYGIAEGDLVSISTEHGAITVPAVVGQAADGVVWLPTTARGCAVRPTLRAISGAPVTLSPAVV